VLPHLSQKSDPLGDVLRERVRASIVQHGGNVRAVADELRRDYGTMQRLITRLGLRAELDRVRERAKRAAA